jgi:hypothetical protein
VAGRVNQVDQVAAAHLLLLAARLGALRWQQWGQGQSFGPLLQAPAQGCCCAPACHPAAAAAAAAPGIAARRPGRARRAAAPSWRLSLAAHLRPQRRARHIEQRDGGGLHGDAPGLLIIAAVQVAQLAHHLGVDEAVGADQVVRQRRLAVVHVRHDAHVADALLRRGGQGARGGRAVGAWRRELGAGGRGMGAALLAAARAAGRPRWGQLHGAASGARAGLQRPGCQSRAAGGAPPAAPAAGRSTPLTRS